MKVYDWNINHRIRETEYLFEVGVIGLVLGIITIPLPTIGGLTASATAVMYGLSSILLGIGIGTMLFSIHHIKYLIELKKAEETGETLWIKI